MTASIDEDTGRVLRRLAAQHEVLRVRIGDLDATSDAISTRAAYDVDTNSPIAAFLRGDTLLRAEAEQADTDNRTSTQRTLQRLGIAGVELSREIDTVPAVLRLLERHRRARV